MDAQILEVKEKRIVVGAPFVYKAVGNRVTLSGYGSTVNTDLYGDNCPADSWDKWLPLFKANPLYCYNHDIRTPNSFPIGRVNNPYADEGGLMLDDIVLSDIPLVRDLLSPLIQDKVLTQQSVGFFNFRKKKEGNTQYLLENMLQEGSIVPLAANPFGTQVAMKTLDGMHDFTNLEELTKAYLSGQLVICNKHYVPQNYPTFSEPVNKHQDENVNVAKISELVVTQHDGATYDPEGTLVAKPANKHAKGFSEVSALTHAAYVETDGTRKYLFEIGVPTAKGFRYDWNLVAVATAKVLGARGGISATAEERKSLLERLNVAYDCLNKSFPSYKATGSSMSGMPAWKLDDIAFAEVSFGEAEGQMIKTLLLKQDITNVLDALKKGDVTLKDVGDKGVEMLKYLYGSVDLSLYVSLDDADELNFFTSIISAIAAYQQEDQVEDLATELAEMVDGLDNYELGYFKFEDKGNTVRAKGVKGKQGFIYTFDATEKSWTPTKAKVSIPDSATKIKSLDRANVAQKLAKSLDTYINSVSESAADFPKPVVDVTRMTELQKSIFALSQI